jgi:hypothetical protein
MSTAHERMEWARRDYVAADREILLLESKIRLADTGTMKRLQTKLVKAREWLDKARAKLERCCAESGD